MLTGHDPARLPLACVAIECFLRQLWPNRELLILNQGRIPISPRHSKIRELLIDRRGRSLGELRNTGLDEASGDWIIQWDDDDWSAPERIGEQLACAMDEGVACVLGSQLRYCLRTCDGYISDEPNGHPNTIIHARQIAFRYPDYERSEDSAFASCFGEFKRVLRERQDLYCRMYHGRNLCSGAHVIRQPGDPTRRELGPRFSAYLRDRILPDYGCRP